MTQEKRVMIIGENGQLGAALIDVATRRGYMVFGYDRSDFDITDCDAARRQIYEVRPTVVINASAYHVVRDCEDHPELAYATNTLAVTSLAAICRDLGIRFVTYSTDYVFDGAKGLPYIETDYPRPLQVYGVSKLAGEYGAQNAYNNGTIIIRTCGLYGGREGSPMKGGNFVINILKEAKERESIEVSSDQIVSPTFGRDLANATYTLLNRETASGIYHLVNEGACSWYEFTQEIVRIAGMTVRVDPVVRGQEGRGMMRPVFSALTNTRAKALGVVLPKWQEGLKAYLDAIMTI